MKNVPGAHSSIRQGEKEGEGQRERGVYYSSLTLPSAASTLPPSLFPCPPKESGFQLRMHFSYSWRVEEPSLRYLEPFLTTMTS